MADGRCKSINSAGENCSAHPLKDTDFCLAHSDEETRASTGFGGSEAGKLGGRPKNPRAVDVLRERMEANIDEVLEPLFEALKADQGLALAVKGGGMEIGLIPDHRTRIQAARELLDRAYGKPKQTTELSGPDGGPVELIAPVDAEAKSARAARLLAERGLVDGDA